MADMTSGTSPERPAATCAASTLVTSVVSSGERACMLPIGVSLTPEMGLLDAACITAGTDVSHGKS